MDIFKEKGKEMKRNREGIWKRVNTKGKKRGRDEDPEGVGYRQ